MGGAKTPNSRFISFPADSHDDVLLSVQHIRHRCAALLGGHVNGAGFFSCSFIVGTEHGAALAICRSEYAGLASNDQCLRDQSPDDSGPARTRHVEAFQSWVIAN